MPYANTDSVVTPANNLPYIVAVALMAVVAVLSVVAVIAVRPMEDNSVLIATILGFITTTTASLLAFMKSQETHLSVNSRLDAFMRNAALAAHIQGIVDGRTQGRQEADARTDALANAPTTNVTVHLDPPPKD